MQHPLTPPSEPGPEQVSQVVEVWRCNRKRVERKESARIADDPYVPVRQQIHHMSELLYGDLKPNADPSRAEYEYLRDLLNALLPVVPESSGG